MDTRVKPFAYRLSALLKKDRWEGQILGVETGRARSVMEESRKRLQEALDDIARTETELREMWLLQQPVSPERRQILDLFLRHQYAVAALRQKDSTSAEGVYAQVLKQLQSKHKSIKAMESHEQRKRVEHDDWQAREAFKAQDDSWLLRKR
jgi:hypothetical protein